jgi:hypothetical protein
MIMALPTVLSSGYGLWDPILWVIAFIIGIVIAWMLWKSGVSSYKKGSEQGRPYLSGNAEPAKGEVHIRASNLYWGFTEGIKGYYQRVVPLHTGIATDYLLWIFWVTGILLIIVMVV